MAEAKIQLPGGATVDVKGTAEEVAKVLGILQERKSGDKQNIATGEAAKRKSARRRAAGTEGDNAGPFPANSTKGYILELKVGGFFKGKKRTLAEVKEALTGMGQIYSDSTVGARLLDLVKGRYLGRVKEDGVWRYVHRN